MGQLFNMLRDTDVLAWDFFLGRLDLLSMEAHVGLENATDLGAFPTGMFQTFICIKSFRREAEVEPVVQQHRQPMNTV